MLGGKGQNFDQNLDQTALLIAITAGLEARASLAASFSWSPARRSSCPWSGPASASKRTLRPNRCSTCRAGGLFTLGFVYGESER